MLGATYIIMSGRYKIKMFFFVVVVDKFVDSVRSWVIHVTFLFYGVEGKYTKMLSHMSLHLQNVEQNVNFVYASVDTGAPAIHFDRGYWIHIKFHF